jgi:uncharacterized protein YecE (DUF72 family)
MSEERGRFYLGAMGWSYKFWPEIYPKSAKSTDYLAHYSKHFDSVEINSSFYRIPSRKTVLNWSSLVPSNFCFTAKFPQSISHSPKLEFEHGKLEAFLNNIGLLGEKLGVLLLQLPPRLKIDHLPAFQDLLSVLPDDFKFAVEFRNNDWFTEDIYKILRENDVTLVQVENPKLLTVTELTSDHVYIRWEGDRKMVNGEKGIVELDRRENNIRWANHIGKLLEDYHDVYGYFSKFYSGYPPTDIRQITDMIRNPELHLT